LIAEDKEKRKKAERQRRKKDLRRGVEERKKDGKPGVRPADFGWAESGKPREVAGNNDL